MYSNHTYHDDATQQRWWGWEAAWQSRHPSLDDPAVVEVVKKLHHMIAEAVRLAGCGLAEDAAHMMIEAQALVESSTLKHHLGEDV
jgi:hypothetical protein